MRWIGLDQGGGQSWNAPNPRPLIETSCCSPTIITCTSEFKLTYIPPPPTPKKQNAMSPRGHRRPLSSTICASHAGVRALPVFHVESQPTCFPCIWDYVQLLFNSYSFVDAGEINPLENHSWKNDNPRYSTSDPRHQNPHFLLFSNTKSRKLDSYVIYVQKIDIFSNMRTNQALNFSLWFVVKETWKWQ